MGTSTDAGPGDESTEELSTGSLLAVIVIVAVTLAGGTLLVAPDVGPQLFPSSEADEDGSDSRFSVTWSDSPLVDDGTGSSSSSDSSNNSAAVGQPNEFVLDDEPMTTVDSGEADAAEPDTATEGVDEPNSEAGEAGNPSSSDQADGADEARDERGPPDHAGPPEHAGAPDDAGPPDHAGPPNAGGTDADDGNGD